jgi:hypothetical protein
MSKSQLFTTKAHILYVYIHFRSKSVVFEMVQVLTGTVQVLILIFETFFNQKTKNDIAGVSKGVKC